MGSNPILGVFNTGSDDMPPHCDTMDGPIVTAAKRALETGNVNLVLPWVPKKAEDELREAFEKTINVRKQSKEAADVADYWFFETAVRLHREGEGAPYTGLKPAGLDVGPVVPLVEKAIEKGDSRELREFLQNVVKEEIEEKFENVMSKKNYDEDDVDAAREYVGAFLGLTLYSHHLYTIIRGNGHGKEGKHEH